MIKLKKIINENIEIESDDNKIIYLGTYKNRPLYLFTMETKTKFEPHINLIKYKSNVIFIGEGNIRWLEKILNNMQIDFPNNEWQEETFDTERYDYVFKNVNHYYLSYLNNSTYIDSDDLVTDLITKLNKNNKNYFMLIGEK